MPFEKRFLKKWFSRQLSSKPPSPQETEHRKEKKRKKKKKVPRLSLNKRRSQYFERSKTLQLQRSFLMWFHFLPLHHTISKTLSKIIEKVFLALFGPSFSLTIYMTWVVPFLFTHELHIFSLFRVGWKGTFVELRWGTTKRVPECLMLRNHSIIFSPVDFKKRQSRRDTDERFHLSTTQDEVKNSTKAPWGK
jgi:hypothetical protein